MKLAAEPEPEPEQALGLPPALAAPVPAHPFKAIFKAMKQEPRYRHRLELDNALLGKRFTRCRWPLAAHWLDPSATARGMHVEWRVTPLKKMKGLKYTVAVFLEPAEGGIGEQVATREGCEDSSLVPVVGYVSTTKAGESVRVEVTADEGCGSGGKVEVCCK